MLRNEASSGCIALIVNQRVRFRVGDLPRDLSGGQPNIERDQHCPDASDGMDQHGKIRAIAHRQRDPASFFDAESSQPTRYPIDALIKFAEGPALFAKLQGQPVWGEISPLVQPVGNSCHSEFAPLYPSGETLELLEIWLPLFQIRVLALFSLFGKIVQ